MEELLKMIGIMDNIAPKAIKAADELADMPICVALAIIAATVDTYADRKNVPYDEIWDELYRMAKNVER